MSGVGAVVFDWYNTLAAPNGDDFWVRIPEIIAAAGGTPVEQALHEWEAGHPLEHQEQSVSEARYREWQRHRFTRLLEQSGVSEPERSRVTAEIEHVRYTRGFTIFDDVRDVLAALRNPGLVVGICSNWDWDLDRHLHHNEIQDLVDFVVCSAVQGHRKPHLAIFDTVVSSAGRPRDQILFVGDNLFDDVGGAATAGLRPVHIDRHNSCQPSGHRHVPCIPELRPLLGMVG